MIQRLSLGWRAQARTKKPVVVLRHPTEASSRSGCVGVMASPCRRVGAPTEPCRALHGLSDLDRILSGNVADLYVVRQYLDAQCGIIRPTLSIAWVQVARPHPVLGLYASCTYIAYNGTSRTAICCGPQSEPLTNLGGSALVSRHSGRDQIEMPEIKLSPAEMELAEALAEALRQHTHEVARAVLDDGECDLARLAPDLLGTVAVAANPLASSRRRCPQVCKTPSIGTTRTGW